MSEREVAQPPRPAAALGVNRVATTVGEGVAMSITGTVTSSDVLWNSARIIRLFGARTYIRCCLAIVRRRRTTFLNCVFADCPAESRLARGASPRVTWSHARCVRATPCHDVRSEVLTSREPRAAD